MGKLMNKSKISGDITVTELFSQPTATVRTRAASKSLAFHKSSLPDLSSSSYLQLRNRRLDKTDASKHTSKPKKPSRSSRSAAKTAESLNRETPGLGFESPAENLEFELSRRGASESTAGSRKPCSPAQYSNETASNVTLQNNVQRTIPTAHEIEEFFVLAEHQQQRSFIDKYNYDIVNDKPLDGRYEWVELVL